MKNPAKVEQEVLQDLEQFAEGSETINKDQLQDWLFKIHPEFDDDLLDGGTLSHQDFYEIFSARGGS